MLDQQTNVKENISNQPITLDILKSEIQKNNFNFENFEEFYRQKREEKTAFLSLLEWACQLKKDDKDLQKLLRRCALENVSDLMEDLKRLGYGIQKELGEDFEKMGYRILEQVRAGKRSDAMHSITRIFIANKRNLPDVLIQAFKPYYDVETFQCLLYSFLSAAIKPKERQKEE